MDPQSLRLQLLGFAIAGYLVGGFPTGVVLSRGRYGIDVREMGSGNIGATNITRVFGWSAGVLTFFIDVMKGFLPVFLLRRYYPENPWLPTVTGAFLVLGHCFSPYLKLRGGKGVATSVGAVSALSPGAALAGAVAYGTTLGVTRISAIGSLAGMAATLGFVALAQPPRPARFLVYAVSFVVLVQHRSNIVRLIKGFVEKRRKK